MRSYFLPRQLTNGGYYHFRERTKMVWAQKKWGASASQHPHPGQKF